MRTYLIVLFSFLPFVANAWNVTALGQYDPPGLAHYNDVIFVGGSTAYMSGSGGFSILNISNLSAPTRTGHLQRPNQEPLPNCAVLSNKALVCAVEGGLHVVNIANPAAPSLYTTFAAGEYNFEDAQFIDEQTALVCIGAAGIGLLSLSDPTAPAWITVATQGLSYTHCLALSPDLSTLYIGDDAGLVVYSRSGDILTYLGTLPISNSVRDVQIDGNRAYLALGAGGVAIADITNPNFPALLGEFSTSAFAYKLSISGTTLAVATWEDIDLYDVSDPVTAVLAGSRWTPGRAMCVALRSDTLLVGDWEIFRTYRYALVTGPDLDVVPRQVQFPVTPVGTSRATELLVMNTGQQTVTFNSIQIQNPDYTLDFTNSPLVPGDTVEATLTYTPTEGTSGTSLMRFNSNDPDEPQINIRLIGNPPPGGVSVGNYAPDFELPRYGGGTWHLSDYRGRIVVMCFFASW